MKKTKVKVREGETAKDDRGRFLMVDEVFAADGVLWVQVAYVRKISRVKYNGKTHIVYDKERSYLSEFEWQIIKKQSPLSV